MREIKVDLPALGNPTKPTSASSFSSSRKLLFFARLSVFVFPRSLMPGLGEFRIAVAASATSAPRRQIALTGLRQIEKLFARIGVENYGTYRNFQNMSSPKRPWQFEPSPSGRARREFAIVAVTQQGVVVGDWPR